MPLVVVAVIGIIVTRLEIMGVILPEEIITFWELTIWRQVAIRIQPALAGVVRVEIGKGKLTG